MTPSSDQLQLLCAHDWLHSFEEDEGSEEVYRPADAPVPAARRPRERVRLTAGGAATVFVGGADDRARGLAAEWQASGGDVVVRIPDGPAARSTYRIVSIAPDVLRIRVS
jgi:hypothetical protein